MTELPKFLIPPASYIPNLPEPERRKRVVLVASLCAEPLELIGPMNVFRLANMVLDLSGRRDMGYDLEVVSSHLGEIFEMDGLKISTDKPYQELSGEVDTLLIPPMDFDVLFEGQEQFLGWIAAKSTEVRRIASICAGTYVLAAAGILVGKRATTHWDLEKDFVERYPDVQLDVDPIYVKDGHIYTSAGMTAGIDMTIALIEEDFGRAVALRVAQGLVVFLKRPGSQSQFSTQLSYDLSEKSEIAELQSYIYDNVGDDLSIDELASRVGMSSRNFSRTFTKEVGLAPGRFVERCRLEMARLNLEGSSLPITKVAERCGYGSGDSMRMAFERQLGLNPRAYRQRFATSSSNHSV
jgi:transcriptional regulator GlxA family with amidase domain